MMKENTKMAKLEKKWEQKRGKSITTTSIPKARTKGREIKNLKDMIGDFDIRNYVQLAVHKDDDRQTERKSSFEDVSDAFEITDISAINDVSIRKRRTETKTLDMQYGTFEFDDFDEDDYEYG